MTTKFRHSLFIALLMSLFSASIVLAHGEPTITVAPTLATPGANISITGSDWENGEDLKLTLESASGVFELGQATASGEGDEAGFTTTFVLPTNLQPGSYLLRCVAGDGHTATADLTIAVSSESVNTQMEASAKPLVLDRSKSPVLIGAVTLLAFVSASLGVWLIRSHGATHPK